jgi:xylulose-5-phosphate/fructose-6-phosphate phosphoketolase
MATSRILSRAPIPEHASGDGGDPEHCIREIRRIQQEARKSGSEVKRPRWPMVILRSPKGWTGPKEVDGHKVEGFWRAHQVPMAEMHENPSHLAS